MEQMEQELNWCQRNIEQRPRNRSMYRKKFQADWIRTPENAKHQIADFKMFKEAQTPVIQMQEPVNPQKKKKKTVPVSLTITRNVYEPVTPPKLQKQSPMKQSTIKHSWTTPVKKAASPKKSSPKRR